MKGTAPRKIKIAVVVVLICIPFLFYLALLSESEMPKIFIVRVSDLQKAIFPPLCVVCGQAGGSTPLVTFNMKDEHGRFDFYFYRLVRRNPDRLIGHSFLNIPVHRECIKKVQYAFWMRFLLFLTVLALVVAFTLVKRFDSFWAFMAAMIMLGLFIYVEFKKPAPVEFNHSENQYEVIFKEEAYAQEFARLNKARVEEVDYFYHTIRRY